MFPICCRRFSLNLYNVQDKNRVDCLNLKPGMCFPFDARSLRALGKTVISGNVGTPHLQSRRPQAQRDSVCVCLAVCSPPSPKPFHCVFWGLDNLVLPLWSQQARMVTILNSAYVSQARSFISTCLVELITYSGTVCVQPTLSKHYLRLLVPPELPPCVARSTRCEPRRPVSRPSPSAASRLNAGKALRSSEPQSPPLRSEGVSIPLLLEWC